MTDDTIPFHSGEIEVQVRAGVRTEAEQLSRVISNTLKPAALEFLRSQPLAIAASRNFAGTAQTIADGQVWASLLTGSPGFIYGLNQQTVQIKGTLPLTDPLHQNLSHDPKLGLLVIDLSNRRRLRLNGRVTAASTDGLQVQIQQVFFNCPKYIQLRHLEATTAKALNAPKVQTRRSLNESDRRWVAQADTFFIATTHPEGGMDTSHRGGHPGFIHVVNADKLVFPDYIGNNMFQTLGNLAVSPKAGLLLIDFEQGHTLQLTGEATIIWDAELLTTFAGAQRLVEFSIEQILETQNATPLRWQFIEYSPANP